MQDSLAQRYGADSPVFTQPEGDAATVVAGLLRHRSVRRFTDRHVDDSVLHTLVAAAQSASTSSNLQCWSVIVVRDRDRIESLVEAGASAFVGEVPVVLVFVADWSRAAGIAERSGATASGLDYLEMTLVGFVDAALAAQNATVAAEAMGLGACYLGSLRNAPVQIAADLHLPERCTVAFGLALGYPASGHERPLKPRLPREVVMHQEVYRERPDEVEAYADRLDEYYASIGRPEASWRRDVIAKVRDAAGLRGRDTMRDSLAAQGLPSN
ncbi:nitroreductase family protein [Microbacterium sp.]|uniref:nitroreductase family protein n=1 Tax=Microbacterium sp. TaxID=51671 RepID=UPI003A83DD89